MVVVSYDNYHLLHPRIQIPLLTLREDHHFQQTGLSF
jgi:hypothetical protein